MKVWRWLVQACSGARGALCQGLCLACETCAIVLHSLLDDMLRIQIDIAGYREPTFPGTAGPFGWGGPLQFRRPLPSVPSPLRRGVPRDCSRFFTPSMAFALTVRARLSLCPQRRTPIDAAGFA